MKTPSHLRERRQLPLSIKPSFRGPHMDRPIEIVTLERGVKRSIRLLSRRQEHRLGGYSASAAAGIASAAFAGFAMLTWASGFVLHAPGFFATAAVAVGLASGVAWRRATNRAKRYRIGPRVDDDAFAAEAVDLVRRRSDGDYELALLHGMTGIIEEAGVRRPIEALTVRDKVVRVPMAGAVARIEMAETTFVVQPAA